MAGRYLLIEFDNEAEASSLRAQIDTASSKGRPFRVVGIYARPGTTCICIISSGQRAKSMVKRGSKFGWWLCQSCGKPRLGNHDLKNLLIPSDIISPALFAGVDTLSVSKNTHDYIRHPESISVITMPGQVASNKEG